MLDLKNFTISDQEVHVWTIALSNRLVSVDEIKGILSFSELQKIDELNGITEKERYTYYRGLLKLILSKYVNIQPEELIINVNNKGKPFIKDSVFKFNISHKEDFAVVAVTKNSDIGIDVEDIDRDINYLRLVSRFFTEEEKKIFNQLKPSNQRTLFFRVWTMKEAFVKALGQELIKFFDRFSVKFSENGIIGVKFKGDPFKYHWWFQNRILFDRYACSIVTTGVKKKVKYFNL